MNFAILGMGTAAPATVLDQTECQFVAQSLCHGTHEQDTWLPTMYKGTGISTRHLAFSRAFFDDLIFGTRDTGSEFLPTGAPGDCGPSTARRMEMFRIEAPPLALGACEAALTESGLDHAEVTHLITVSCTGLEAPGVDQFLIRELGLAPTIQRTNVGFMGCHGALNGLRVARAFAGADPGANVLLCAVELCSVHYFYGWDPGRMIANAIFADGAAAVVGKGVEARSQGSGIRSRESGVRSRESGVRSRESGVRGQESAVPGDSWQVVASGSCIFPGSADAMSWKIGDHGFLMSLSKKVPGLIAAHLRPWLENWLRSLGLTLHDIPSWAIHPGGPRILAAAREALELTADQTADAQATFAEFGNMSSPTVLFILKRMRRRQASRPCVALGFGPGLAVEAALLV